MRCSFEPLKYYRYPIIDQGGGQVGRLYSIALYTFILFLFTPRYNFFQLPGGVSDLRTDVLAMFAFWGPLFLFLTCRKYVFRRPETFLGFGFILICLPLMLVTSSSIFSAAGNALWYLSLLGCFSLGCESASKENRGLKFIVMFAVANAAMHLVGRALTGLLDYTTLNLWFGFYHVPSPYGLTVGLGVISILYSRERLRIGAFEYSFLLTILLAGLILSDSRVSLIATVIGIFLHRINSVRSLVFIASLITLGVLVGGKASSIFHLLDRGLVHDPSLIVRYVNFERYLEWVDPIKFIFGGGALSFLEYSIQYGKPGHLDSLYLKILSDNGFIGFLMVCVGLAFLTCQGLKKKNRRTALLPLLIFLIIYSVVNEGLVSVKSGHLAFFSLGFWFSCHKLDFRNRSVAARLNWYRQELN